MVIYIWFQLQVLADSQNMENTTASVHVGGIKDLFSIFNPTIIVQK